MPHKIFQFYKEFQKIEVKLSFWYPTLPDYSNDKITIVTNLFKFLVVSPLVYGINKSFMEVVNTEISKFSNFITTLPEQNHNQDVFLELLEVSLQAVSDVEPND